MAIIIHSVQKLLNTSRLKAVQYISQPGKEQFLHSWYARLVSTGFPGKLLVMYVHEPSLLTVVCRGKTIGGTWDDFCKRLPALLERFQFSPTFILSEMAQIDSYIVAKTNSKSMLSYMNQMVMMLEIGCERYSAYESILQDKMENTMMKYLYSTGNKNNPYTTPGDYWKTFFSGLSNV
jgi:hypothetical protein